MPPDESTDPRSAAPDSGSKAPRPLCFWAEPAHRLMLLEADGKLDDFLRLWRAPRTEGICHSLACSLLCELAAAGEAAPWWWIVGSRELPGPDGAMKDGPHSWLEYEGRWVVDPNLYPKSGPQVFLETVAEYRRTATGVRMELSEADLPHVKAAWVAAQSEDSWQKAFDLLEASGIGRPRGTHAP